MFDLQGCTSSLPLISLSNHQQLASQKMNEEEKLEAEVKSRKLPSVQLGASVLEATGNTINMMNRLGLSEQVEEMSLSP